MYPRDFCRGVFFGLRVFGAARFSSACFCRLRYFWPAWKSPAPGFVTFRSMRQVARFQRNRTTRSFHEKFTKDVDCMLPTLPEKTRDYVQIWHKKKVERGTSFIFLTMVQIGSWQGARPRQQNWLITRRLDQLKFSVLTRPNHSARNDNFRTAVDPRRKKKTWPHLFQIQLAELLVGFLDNVLNGRALVAESYQQKARPDDANEQHDEALCFHHVAQPLRRRPTHEIPGEVTFDTRRAVTPQTCWPSTHPAQDVEIVGHWTCCVQLKSRGDLGEYSWTMDRKMKYII